MRTRAVGLCSGDSELYLSLEAVRPPFLRCSPLSVQSLKLRKFVSLVQGIGIGCVTSGMQNMLCHPHVRVRDGEELRVVQMWEKGDKKGGCSLASLAVFSLFSSSTSPDAVHELWSFRFIVSKSWFGAVKLGASSRVSHFAWYPTSHERNSNSSSEASFLTVASKWHSKPWHHQLA